MVETFTRGRGLQPDLCGVQREGLWATRTLHVPLNSAWNLWEPGVGRGGQEGRETDCLGLALCGLQ